MHTSHTYHCHEHDAHKEHTHGRIFFRYRAQQIIDLSLIHISEPTRPY